jgi:hypothetical protein
LGESYSGIRTFVDLSICVNKYQQASQVKPSLLDEVEVEVLQEGLVEATTIGL